MTDPTSNWRPAQFREPEPLKSFAEEVQAQEHARREEASRTAHQLERSHGSEFFDLARKAGYRPLPMFALVKMGEPRWYLRRDERTPATYARIGEGFLVDFDYGESSPFRVIGSDGLLHPISAPSQGKGRGTPRSAHLRSTGGRELSNGEVRHLAAVAAVITAGQPQAAIGYASRYTSPQG